MTHSVTSDRAKAFALTICDLTALAGAFMILNWGLIITGDAYALRSLSDLRQLTMPVMTFSGHSLVRGDLPLWNPYMAAGFPNHAMGCAGVFYPTTLLYGLLPFARAYVWDVLAHQALAAVSAYAAARAFSMKRPTALLAGLLTMSALPFTESFATLGHIWTIRALGWTPLAFLGLMSVLRTPRTNAVIGLALPLSMQILAGDLQIVLCQGYIFGAFAVGAVVIRFFRRHDTRQRPIRTLAALAASLGVTATISAIQWIPSWEFMRHSVRGAGVTLEYVRAFARDEKVSAFAHTILYTHWAFPSAAGACLLILGWASTKTTLRWPALFAFAITLFLAAWTDTILAPLVHRLPLLGQAREPERIFEPLAILIPLVCAYYLERAHAAHGNAAPQSFFRLFAFSVIGILFACWATGLPILHAIAFGVASCAAWVTAQRAGPGRMRVALLCIPGVLLAYETLTQQQPNVLAIANPDRVAARDDAYDLVPPMQYEMRGDIKAAVQETSPNNRVAVFTQVFHTGEASFGSAVARRMLASYHALQPANFVEWFDGLAGVPLAVRTKSGELDADRYNTWSNPKWVTRKAFPILDLLNIRHLILTDDPLPNATVKAAARQHRFDSSKVHDVTVLTNYRALQPVFTVHRTQAADSIADVTATLGEANTFDYQTTALVSSFFDSRQVTPADGRDSVTIDEYGSSHVDITATMTAAGLLVLTDLNYPGWRATIDGHSTEVIPAYGILKAVAVPPGTHTVRFQYDSTVYRAGYWLAIAALTLTLLTALKTALRRKPKS